MLEYAKSKSILDAVRQVQDGDTGKASRVVYSITLEDLYCGLALAGMLALHSILVT